MSHLLFLSHAGPDSDRALAIAKQIEESEAARSAGLRVWIDKLCLQPGKPWQTQLEEAIATESTAFAVYISGTNTANWVLMEVRAALERVIADGRAGRPFAFIPILEHNNEQIACLPTFARQYQGVVLSEGSAAIQKLIAAALNASTILVPLVAEPFVGLSAFADDQAHLFFGREQDTQHLLARMAMTPLVMVIGDSGSGKSSVVRAGVIPAFRDGQLAPPLEPRPESRLWHVVQMRPKNDPFASLIDAVSDAVRTIEINDGLYAAAVAAARAHEVHSIVDLLREGAPPGARVLLFIDQFEELWTQTQSAQVREKFIDALLQVTESSGVRNLLVTMRRDYFAHCSSHTKLKEYLEQGVNAASADRRAVYNLRRMRDEQLRSCIEKPLALAGVPASEASELADEVLRDSGDQPGDLALIEVALTKAWQNRKGGDLRLAYRKIGRVEGALEMAASEALAQLEPREQTDAESLFMRLVTQSAHGGTTRRVGRRTDFSPRIWELAQKLATKEFSRLLVTSAERDDRDQTVELAHEQLAIHWAQYVQWLRGTPERAIAKRTLDTVMENAARWVSDGGRLEDLTSGTKLDESRTLKKTHDAWLSDDERRFIGRSNLKARVSTILVVLLGLTFSGAGWWAYRDAIHQAMEKVTTATWESIQLQDQQATQSELAALKKLAAEDRATRLAFLAAIRTSNTRAMTFLRDPQLIARNVLGVDRALREDVLEEVVLSPTPSESTPTSRLAVAMLGSSLREFRPWHGIVGDESVRLEYYRILRSKSGSAEFKRAFIGISSEQAAELVEPILKSIDTEKRLEGMVVLGSMLTELPAKLDIAQSRRVVTAIVRIKESDTDGMFTFPLSYIMSRLKLSVDTELLRYVLEARGNATQGTSSATPASDYWEPVDAVARYLRDEDTPRAVALILGAAKTARSSNGTAPMDLDSSLRWLEVTPATAVASTDEILSWLQRNPSPATVYSTIGFLRHATATVSAADAGALRAKIRALLVTQPAPSPVASALGLALASLPASADAQEALQALDSALAGMKQIDSVQDLNLISSLALDDYVESIAPYAGKAAIDALLVVAADPTVSEPANNAVGRSLVAVASRLDVEQASRLTSTLLGRIKRYRGSPNERYDATLWQICEKMQPAVAASVFPLVFRWFESATEIEAMRIEYVLRALARQIDAPNSRLLAPDVLDAMERATGRPVSFAVAQSVLNEWSRDLDPKTVERGHLLLVRAVGMHQENSAALSVLYERANFNALTEDEALGLLQRSVAALDVTCPYRTSPPPSMSSFAERTHSNRVQAVTTIISGIQKHHRCQYSMGTLQDALRIMVATSDPSAEPTSSKDIKERIFVTLEQEKLPFPVVLSLIRALGERTDFVTTADSARATRVFLKSIERITEPRELAEIGSAYGRLHVTLESEVALSIFTRYGRAAKSGAESYSIEETLFGVWSNAPDDFLVARMIISSLGNPSLDEGRVLQFVQQRFKSDFAEIPDRWQVIAWAEKRFGAAALEDVVL
jgi:hypothetical protein